jgi:hypothetical protein
MRLCDPKKIKFEKPSGFTISDSVENFVPRRNVLLNTSFLKLVSSDENVIIYTTIFPYDTTGTNSIRRFYYPKYDRHNNYINKIKSQIDSSVTKVKYFKGDTLAKLNATDAGIYTLAMDRPYKRIYNHAKVLFMTKNEVSDIELVYFYVNGTDIDKYINQTLFCYSFR